jgi:hypothetical protein
MMMMMKTEDTFNGYGNEENAGIVVIAIYCTCFSVLGFVLAADVLLILCVNTETSLPPCLTKNKMRSVPCGSGLCVT